jgi:NAD(P)-dependent dehydrogenase (short-subunit alcohol dehydrogenase family)
VVTGGAGGIGAAIAAELGRQGDFVVVADPYVTTDGRDRLAVEEEPAVVRTIISAGGQARLCPVSVTDADQVRGLFDSLAAEHGSVDIVVNAAGIIRGASLSSGSAADWAAELDVHLNGYLNILAAALPVMARAGYGRVLGVTSGAGWRAADAGSYSCAKRAVAALTWSLGRQAPDGVCVNALSPVAMTRMVSSAMNARAGSRVPSTTTTGGLELSVLPPPEALAPSGAYLVSEQFGWSRGQVVFASGSEMSVIAAPRPIELVSLPAGAASLQPVLDRALTAAFIPAERAQGSSGAVAPRFAGVFTSSADAAFPAASPQPGVGPRGSCLIVTDDTELECALSGVLRDRGCEPVHGGWGSGEQAGDRGFAAADAAVRGAAAAAGPLDAVVVALARSGGGRAAGDGSAASGDGWRASLADHAGLASDILADAAWVRAAVNYAAGSSRRIRIVTVVPAVSPAGATRAQAAAQLARASKVDPGAALDAFAISAEGTGAASRAALVELIAALLGRADAAGLAGAELAVSDDWVALRAHPAPAGSVSFGGPGLPPWLPGSLRAVMGEEVPDNGPGGPGR